MEYMWLIKEMVLNCEVSWLLLIGVLIDSLVFLVSVKEEELCVLDTSVSNCKSGDSVVNEELFGETFN